MIDETGDLSLWCEKSATDAHAADPDSFVGRYRTKARCRHCGEWIHRAHRRSSRWWVDYSKPESEGGAR